MRSLTLALVGLVLTACGGNATSTYRVKLATSKGDIVIEVDPGWARKGSDRFRQLLEMKYFDGCRFYRVVPGWVAQWGMHGDPKINARWANDRIDDDPVKAKNVRGTVAFAMSGPNSRSNQLFINLVDNSAKLDIQGFSPIGRVVEGMDVVDKLYRGYGDAPQPGQPGNGPLQERIAVDGNKYLEVQFPKLDFIRTATFVD